MAEGKDLSIAEAARFLGVDPKTVHNWIHSGKLTAYQMGRLWRIPQSALSEFKKWNNEEDIPEAVEGEGVVKTILLTYPDGTSRVIASWREGESGERIAR